MRPRCSLHLVILVFFLASLAAGCSQGGTGIVVQDPFARPAPAAGSGGAFMIIVNNTAQADRLVSAQSPAAMMVELHETVNEGGVMKMVHQPQGFEVPARGRVELKPGGKHVMLMGLKNALEAGQTIQITLKFEKAGEMTIDVPVREMK